MNIGFDAKRAFHNKTGLGNYSRALISAMDTHFSENNYSLFTKNPGNDAFLKWSETLQHTHIVTPQRQSIGALWRSFTIPSLLSQFDIEIYHGLSAELPFGNRSRNVKYIVTIHDLIFLRMPHQYSWFDRKVYFQKTLHACKVADHIIAISEQTKRDLIQYLGIPAHKITVVLQTCDPIFEKKWTDEALKDLRTRLHLPEQFLLNVGTLEARKNALLILKSLVALDTNIHAVFVGKQTDYQVTLNAFIAEHHLEKRVHFLKNISFQDLPGIYRLSAVFVYPSAFEGFGIPVLEAAKSGVPFIAATGSSLEEAGGPGGIYIGPDDVDSLTNNISIILKNTEYKAGQIQAGLAYAQQFSLQRFAQQTMEIYLK